MVTQQACAVGAGEEGEDVPEPFSEIGDRHIRPADEAVAGADNGADGGRLPVCREEEVHAGGEGGAEHGQEQDVEEQEEHVSRREVPTGETHVDETGAGRREADDECGDERRDVVPKPQHAESHGSDRQVVDGAAGLIPDHQEVGAERYRHAGDGEKRGHELSAHTAVDDGVGHRCARQVTFSRTNRKSYTDLGGEPRENK